MIQQQCGKEFVLVTPGIRPAGAEQGDQRRVMTPEQAAKQGIQVLVIGHSITQAADPPRRWRQYRHRLRHNPCLRFAKRVTSI